MNKWLKKLDVSTGLQYCFMISAILCLFVGAVGLYTWSKQRNEISLAIDQDFPKVQAAFQAEEQINLLQNEFNGLVKAKNFNDKMNWQGLIQVRLDMVEKIMYQLTDGIDDDPILNLQKQAFLLDELSNNVSEQLNLNEEFYKLTSKINWLHDDFHDEFIALLQEVSWQQSSLANNLRASIDQPKQLKLLKNLQQELLIIYSFISYEDQIVSELKAQIVGEPTYTSTRLQNYLSYLELLINNKIEQLEIKSSTYTIKQILDELIALGKNNQSLPRLLEKREQLIYQQQKLIKQNTYYLNELRENVRDKVGNSEKQLQLILNIVEKSSSISGVIIVLAMFIAFALVIAVNFFYIRNRLLKRFQILNQSVDQLTNGESNVKIKVYGNDELGRIAKLLRTFIFEINRKNSQLENRNKNLINEINDRIKVQNELVSTQNELIQTAKLAIVGQTLTSINHEINQPLNAMSAYLFSAKKALNSSDCLSAALYLEKINNLIERTALIVKRLRQFTRKREGKLNEINLLESISNAWGLFESQNKKHQNRLIQPHSLPMVIGEEVLIQQVFVNLFLNAMEASENKPTTIKVELFKQTDKALCLFVSDTGKGWPLTENILQPFSSSKSLNLGLGLSISQSIMKHCEGHLSIASTLDKHALIILSFKVVNNVE